MSSAAERFNYSRYILFESSILMYCFGSTRSAIACKTAILISIVLLHNGVDPCDM